jgi:LemA protein
MATTLLLTIGAGLFCLLVVAVLVWALVTYNRLVRQRNQVKASWAQIDVQLKRRHDLIPNLVETVKGYAGHERATLEAVVAARTRAVRATGLADRADAENLLTQTLGRLFALSEAYPDLKANQNMIALHEELTSTENKVAFARQAYNDSVMDYNTKRESFPDSIVAGPFRFDAAELLQATEAAEERKAPKVSFT